jgi:hypothetical protein
MVTMFDDLASIGMELLHAPLIGAEKFVESKPWAKDEVYSVLIRIRHTDLYLVVIEGHELSFVANIKRVARMAIFGSPETENRHGVGYTRSRQTPPVTFFRRGYTLGYIGGLSDV